MLRKSQITSPPQPSSAHTFPRLISLQLPKCPRQALGSGQRWPPPSRSSGSVRGGSWSLWLEITLMGDSPLSGAQPLPLWQSMDTPEGSAGWTWGHALGPCLLFSSVFYSSKYWGLPPWLPFPDGTPCFPSHGQVRQTQLQLRVGPDWLKPTTKSHPMPIAIDSGMDM